MSQLKILLLLLLIISCKEYTPSKKSIITVRGIENSPILDQGKYRYTLHTTHSFMNTTYLYSDEVYKLNDTLQIKK